jgi:hypothetical protein
MTNRVEVAERSIREGCKIEVNATPADVEIFKTRAFARRAGITEVKGTIKDMLTAALSKNTNPVAQEALLSAAGIGFCTRNESTYGYPENMKTYFLDPLDLIDNNQLTWSVIDTSKGSDSIVLSKKYKINDAPIIQPDVPASFLPACPVGRLFTSIELKIGDQAVNITGPSMHINLAERESSIVKLAKVTTCSNQPDTDHTGATDGIVSGFPDDSIYEWASNGEKAGAWIKLDWPKEMTIDRIWLFDRPNKDDHIIAGELTFSDGTSIKVGELPNDGEKGIEIKFQPKKVNWAKFTVTETSPETVNVGIAEICVFSGK